MSEIKKIEDSTYRPDFSKYENDKNHGVTFGTYPMETLAVDRINSQNKKQFLMQYFIEAIQKFVEEGKLKGDDPIPEELRAEAMWTASERVKLNEKAEKAWLKGKQYFNHRKQKYMVPTIQRLEKAMEWKNNFVEKYGVSEEE